MVNIRSTSSLKKTDFPFPQQPSVANIILVLGGTSGPLSFRPLGWDFVGLELVQILCIRSWSLSCVHGLCGFIHVRSLLLCLETAVSFEVIHYSWLLKSF